MSQMWIKWTLVRIYRTEKYYVDLYQAYLDKKRIQIESHTIALEENSLEVNNALVKYNATPLIDFKSLDVSDFFRGSKW